jgi:hypothetical protein
MSSASRRMGDLSVDSGSMLVVPSNKYLNTKFNSARTDSLYVMEAAKDLLPTFEEISHLAHIEQ